MPVSNPIVPVTNAALVGWRLYARFRRNFGRQRLKPTRLMIRICIYCLITLLLAYVSITVASHLNVLLGLVAGLVPGAILGLVGLRLTRFESTPQGRFYTPNAYMGVGLTILLAARIGYRYIMLSNVQGHSSTQPMRFQSPLTYFIFALLMGYYIAYYTGILVHNREK